MGGIERIRKVAARVKHEVASGHEVAVVVSAMAGDTDRLVGLCREAAPLHDLAEYDVVVSSGEQVSSGLLAIVLREMGVPARSWLGWQLPIQSSDLHKSARIREIDVTQMRASMARGVVAIVAGFQAVNAQGRITTLGRGGSDTSAVALAAALGAERCDIYTDVDGVYTTDPRIVPHARKLDRITYEEMLELASVGAKVLQTRSVELAMKEKVRLRVLSSFEDNMGDETAGTLVVNEDEVLEEELITGVAYERNEAKVTLVAVPDRPGAVATVFGPLAAAGVNVDMIVQNVSHAAPETDVTFTVPRADLARARDVLAKARKEIGYTDIIAAENVAKVSIVGVGMRSHAGVAQTMFATLAERGINIQAITTSEIKVSVLIAEEYVELAVRALHTAYGLDVVS